MDDWFVTGHVVDGILLLMAIEALALLGLHLKWRRGPAPFALLASLGAGAALLLALRTALLHSAWPTTACWLLVALIAHACDVGMRLTRDSRPP